MIWSGKELFGPMSDSYDYGRLSEMILLDIRDRVDRHRQIDEAAMRLGSGDAIACADRELLLAEVERLRSKERLFDFELVTMREQASVFVAAIDKIMEASGGDDRETWIDSVRSPPGDYE